MENYEDSIRIPQPLNFFFSSSPKTATMSITQWHWILTWIFWLYHNFQRLLVGWIAVYSTLSLPLSFSMWLCFPLIRGGCAVVPHLRLSLANWMFENITRVKIEVCFVYWAVFLHFCHGHAKNMLQLVLWSWDYGSHMGQTWPGA